MTTAKGQTKYRPSQARYAEGGQVLYLVYHSPQPLRTGRVQERTRVKRVYFPADAKDITLGKPGMVEKRTGRRVFGVPVRYEYELSAAKAQRGRTTYQLPNRSAERVKVVELPEGAKDVRLTAQPPEGPRMAVA
jgi:hypothetical protein